MAYPVIAAPYGLKPINLIGGQVFAGATRQLPIAASYTTAIYYGGVVTLVAGGTIENSPLAADTSPLAGVVGVFLGCTYINPSTKQLTFSQYWPGVAGATNIEAYIADDPDQLYKAVNVAGTTVDNTSSGLLPAYLGQTVVGSNCRLVLNAGSATTGNSKVGIYTAAGATTSSLPLRIVDVVPDTANSSGDFVEFVVKLNFGYHSYYNATGI
jgi:hypothetical protein